MNTRTPVKHTSEKGTHPMSENPYESPISESASSSKRAIGVLSGKREDLKKVAQYQKAILTCILLYLLAVFGQFLLPPQFRPLLGLGVIIVGLVSTIFVFMLALKIYSTATGVILGILALVPCLGLIILLVINSKATKILTENGIKVGLLGANVSRI
jgi:hypothetical protein